MMTNVINYYNSLFCNKACSHVRRTPREVSSTSYIVPRLKQDTPKAYCNSFRVLALKEWSTLSPSIRSISKNFKRAVLNYLMSKDV